MEDGAYNVRSVNQPILNIHSFSVVLNFLGDVRLRQSG